MFYPWENGIKPYFVNKDGYEWYYDDFATKIATTDDSLAGGHTRRGMKNVAAFYVKKGDDVHCVLIDNKQNVICEAETSIGLSMRIETLKIWEDFTLHEVENKNPLQFEDTQLYLKELNKYNPKVRKTRIYTHPNIKELYFDEHNNPIS